jgi:signal transduction histidine kinase
MRLRTKYALALLLTMLVLGSVLFVSTEQFKRQVIEQEQRDLDSTTTLTAEQIDESILDRIDYVRWFAARPEVSNFSQTEATLQSFLDGSNFYAAQLVAPNGTILAFEGDIDESQAEQVVGTNVSDRPYIQEARQPLSGTVISAPEQASDNFTIVTISSKITETTPDGETRVKGILVGAIEIDVSGFFIAKEPLETESQTVSITGENATGSAVTLDASERSFDQRLTSTATIETTGWDVTVTRDRERLTGRLSTLRTVQAGGLFIVLLAFVSLGVWEYRTNLRQTRRLLEGFSELQDGNYDHTVELETAEEWRQMSDGFNQLASGLEQREDELREREQQLSVVNRVLRHNLKNEMTVIQGQAEMMPFLDEQEERVESLETIRETAERLLAHSKKARHINDAIDSAEEGRKPVSCSVMVRRSVQSIADDYPETDVETEIPDDVEVMAISALQYAVDSIVENAFEHNESDEPSVRVWLDVDADTVEIRVADNGPGIPSHEIEVLEQGTETGLEHGSGVGLWLAFWIVKRSEGTLRFTRRDPSGTLVTLGLDRARTEDD